MTEVLQIKNLTYKLNLVSILDDLTCTIPAGSIVGLLGANGAGKTTLMRLISGVAKGFHGEINVNQQTSVVNRKQQISFSHQLDGSDRRARLAQIVHDYTLLYPDFSATQFQQLADFLELDLHQRLSKLSKGNRNKFIVALTLARQVPLYLLDEPFDGIDVMSRKKIIASILKWKSETATILISDHHVNDIANLLDAVVIVKDKHVVAQEQADTIREKYGESIEDYYENLYTGGENDD
ncbi:ABC transporter ATP-binding protein [Loigolactobacillus backii]|uniref:ABC transporter ATP-binding protein n=1 Tax=Loigolactobacillus backii TaxID=375175 RepID=UPI0007F125B3|nr:ABC transporter ATP-binding protein [Loigolactobacillus backii]ANK60183.1 ABC transporter ATP-binding protein [Loigolactobacillus backii]ANK65065.1 ABC transporter ATP-binding protein [Loigolactobacillus backii]ANK67621.1 ABC transporter ATP-binding protein [Loigolactobacillus backii]OLF70102.1 ABC transporter ATP-binding protein [Loigolactobacillus backii]PIO87150.1 ABC transporter ATP-binding protein [Loigolactobacillus backii]